MKKVSYLACLAVLLYGLCSCNVNTKSKNDNSSLTKDSKVVSSTSFSSVDDLLKNAGANLGHSVCFPALVVHVCRHGGGRCYVVGNNSANRIRVVASDDIKSFPVELEGERISITGVLRVSNLTLEDLIELKNEKEKKHASEGEDHHCESDNGLMDSLIARIRKSGEKFVSVYHVDALNYKCDNK